MEIINYVLINYRIITLVCALIALPFILLHLLLLVFLGFDKYPLKFLEFIGRLITFDLFVILLILFVKLCHNL